MIVNIIKKSKFIFKGESIFALFLISGYFKSSLSFLPQYIDITIVFLLLSILISLKRIYLKPSINIHFLVSAMLFLSLSMFMILSLLYTPSNIYAYDKVFRFLIITGWAYIGILILVNDEETLKNFLNTLIIMSLVMGFRALYIYIDQKINGQIFFINVFGSNYLALGRSLGVGTLLFLILYILGEKFSFKLLIKFLLVFIMIFSLLNSGGRTPVSSFFISLLLYFIFSIKISKNKISAIKGTKKLLLLIIILLIIISIMGFLGSFSTVIDRFGMVLQQDGGDSLQVRLDKYLISLDMWYNSPFFGQGVGSFPIYSSNLDTRDYSHNIFLEILSELGLVGLALFLFLLGYSLYNGVKRYKKKYGFMDKIQISLILVFFYLFINSNLSGSLNDNRLLFSFIALLSISPWIKTKARGI